MIFPVLHPHDSAYLLSKENKRDTVDVIDALHFPDFCAEQLKATACELDFAGEFAPARELDVAREQHVSRFLNLVMAQFSDDADKAAQAVTQLQQETGDSSGLTILAIQMRCAVLSRKLYARAGLSDELFVRTFDWFPRFVQWQKNNVDGLLGHRVADPAHPALFTEAFWSPRLLNLSILRFGEFEFEFSDVPSACEASGELSAREESGEFSESGASSSEEGNQAGRVVNLHIPEDARLDAEYMRASFTQFRAFTAARLPRFLAAPLMCESWLLDPALDELLPANSHLREFRSLFSLTGSEVSQDYQKWIAGCEGLSADELPEVTSLQRAVKQYVRSGGVMSCGIGQLSPNKL